MSGGKWRGVPFAKKRSSYVSETFTLHPIPNRVKQLPELKQALWLVTMIVWKPFDFWCQNYEPCFVPTSFSRNCRLRREC